MTRIIWTILLAALLNACTATANNSDPDQANVCKELKRRIIFNGATGNNTTATQQRAELNQLNKSYNARGC